MVPRVVKRVFSRGVLGFEPALLLKYGVASPAHRESGLRPADRTFPPLERAGG
jgi:hypothetical protein